MAGEKVISSHKLQIRNYLELRQISVERVTNLSLAHYETINQSERKKLQGQCFTYSEAVKKEKAQGLRPIVVIIAPDNPTLLL